MYGRKKRGQKALERNGEEEEVDDDKKGWKGHKKGIWTVEGRVPQEWDIYSYIIEFSETCILMEESNRINAKNPHVGCQD